MLDYRRAQLYEGCMIHHESRTRSYKTIWSPICKYTGCKKPVKREFFVIAGMVRATQWGGPGGGWLGSRWAGVRVRRGVYRASGVGISFFVFHGVALNHSRVVSKLHYTSSICCRGLVITTPTLSTSMCFCAQNSAVLIVLVRAPSTPYLFALSLANKTLERSKISWAASYGA